MSIPTLSLDAPDTELDAPPTELDAPDTEIDPAEGSPSESTGSVYERPPPNRGHLSGEAPTDPDPSASAAAEELSTHPDEWSELTHVSHLHASSHSRVTLFQAPAGDFVVVKAFRTQGSDRQPIWAAWEDCRFHGAPLTPLLRTLMSAEVAFEEMPYRTGRSLHEFLTAGDGGPRARLPASELKTVVGQIDAALTALHLPSEDGTFFVHRDVKPSNILISSVNPLSVELSDTETVLIVDPLDPAPAVTKQGTTAYGAPEAPMTVHPPLDYWSLGMSVAELGTGRHPYQRSNTEFYTPHIIRQQISQRLPKIPDGLDEYTLRLVRGLLVRDGSDRFGHEEVSAWVLGTPFPFPAGEAGEARWTTGAPSNNGREEGQGRRRARDAEGSGGEGNGTTEEAAAFRFNGHSYRTPQGIAAAMAADWGEAIRTVLGRDFDRLLEWSEQAQPDLAADLIDVQERRHANAIDEHRAVAEVILCLDRASPPTFQTRACDREGLMALVRQALGGDLEALGILVGLYESNCLEVMARHPAHHGLLHVAERWNYLMGVANRLIRQHVPGGEIPDRPMLTVYTLWALLGKGSRALSHQAAGCMTQRASEVPWFAAIANVGGDVDAAAHHAVLILAAPLAQAERRVVRPELDAWAREYLQREMNARGNPARRPAFNILHRWKAGPLLASLLGIAVVMAVVGTQTWNLEARSVSAFLATTSVAAAVGWIFALRLRRTRGANLLALLSVYGVIGALIGGAAGFALSATGHSDLALPSAWWCWGIAEMVGIVIAVGVNARQPGLSIGDHDGRIQRE